MKGSEGKKEKILICGWWYHCWSTFKHHEGELERFNDMSKAKLIENFSSPRFGTNTDTSLDRVRPRQNTFSVCVGAV